MRPRFRRGSRVRAPARPGLMPPAIPPPRRRSTRAASRRTLTPPTTSGSGFAMSNSGCFAERGPFYVRRRGAASANERLREKIALSVLSSKTRAPDDSSGSVLPRRLRYRYAHTASTHRASTRVVSVRSHDGTRARHESLALVERLPPLVPVLEPALLGFLGGGARNRSTSSRSASVSASTAAETARESSITRSVTGMDRSKSGGLRAAAFRFRALASDRSAREGSETPYTRSRFQPEPPRVLRVVLIVRTSVSVCHSSRRSISSRRLSMASASAARARAACAISSAAAARAFAAETLNLAVPRRRLRRFARQPRLEPRCREARGTPRRRPRRPPRRALSVSVSVLE